MSITDTYDDDDHPLGEDFEDEIEARSDAPDDDEPDPTDIDRARMQGWRPFEEWNGPPEDWKDYKDFLRVADENAPVLRESNRRLTRELERTRKQFDEFKRDSQQTSTALMNEMREMGQRIRSADDRAVDTLRGSLLAERREAVQNADQEEFDRIEAELAKLPPDGTRTTAATAPEPQRTAPQPPPVPQAEMTIINQWVAENPWFLEDQPLKEAMTAMHTTIRRTRPNLPLRQQLDLAKKRLMEDMPDAFDEEEPVPEERPAPQVRRRVAPAVARPSGGAGANPPARKSVWDDVPPDERRAAQAAYEHFKRVNDDPQMPASEYVVLYNNPKADYLELRRQRKVRA